MAAGDASSTPMSLRVLLLGETELHRANMGLKSGQSRPSSDVHDVFRVLRNATVDARER